MLLLLALSAVIVKSYLGWIYTFYELKIRFGEFFYQHLTSRERYLIRGSSLVARDPWLDI
jgi:hypothetical protein